MLVRDKRPRDGGAADPVHLALPRDEALGRQPLAPALLHRPPLLELRGEGARVAVQDERREHAGVAHLRRRMEMVDASPKSAETAVRSSRYKYSSVAYLLSETDITIA